MAEKKRMLEVNFTGKELLNGEVFDTTIENDAKEFNIYNKDKKYGAMTIITGEKELLASIENELIKLKKGEEKVIKLNPTQGFGERKAELVRVVPLKVFNEQKIKPVPGLIINIGNNLAKVQSVSGGRVRVDFNHPLAGRELEYKISVKNEVTDKKEIAEKMFEKYFSQVPNAKKEWKTDCLYITIPESTMKGLENVTKTISKLASDLGSKIEFKTDKAKKEKVSEKESAEEKKE